MPRALYWFRWGAAWTWVTGVLLLLLVFYHGGITFEPEAATGASRRDRDDRGRPSSRRSSTTRSHKSPLGKDPKTFGGVALRPRRGRRVPADAAGPASATAATTSTWRRCSARSWRSTCGSGSGRRSRRSSRAREGGHAARRRARGARRRPLAAQHLHVGAAGLGHDQRSTPRTSPAATSASPTTLAFVLFLVVILLGWHIVWHLYKRARRSRASKRGSAPAKRSSARRARNFASPTIPLARFPLFVSVVRFRPVGPFPLLRRRQRHGSVVHDVQPLPPDLFFTRTVARPVNVTGAPAATFGRSS